MGALMKQKIIYEAEWIEKEYFDEHGEYWPDLDTVVYQDFPNKGLAIAYLKRMLRSKSPCNHGYISQKYWNPHYYARNIGGFDYVEHTAEEVMLDD